MELELESSPRREKSSSQEAIRGEEGDVRVKAERNDDVSGDGLRMEAETRGGS